MNSFREIDNNFESFKKEFRSVVDDSFGKKLDENELENFSQNIKLLIMEEEKIETENLHIKNILMQAQSIISMTGF